MTSFQPRPTVLDSDTAADDAGVRAVLAVFDEPAPSALIEAVLAPPAIPGLTDRFAGLVPAKGARGAVSKWLPGVGRRLGLGGAVADDAVVARWQAAVDRGIAAGEIQAADQKLSLHPDLRDRVRTELELEQSQAWRAANERLHLVYYAAPAHRMPETPPELALLGRAILHACRAGNVQAAYDRIYLARITRGDALHIGPGLGLYQLWLDILQPFVAAPWSEPAPQLAPADGAAVLAHAGVALRALGRFAEAQSAISASVEATRAQGIRLATATAAQNLSEVRQVLGDLPGARVAAEDSVREAEAGGNPFRVLSAQCRVADLAHQQGDTVLAARLFAIAEEKQKAINQGLKHLVSLRHAAYCDLLLATGTPPVDVLRRGLFALNISNGFLGNGMTPLDVALDLLVLGRAAHALVAEGGAATDVLTTDPAEFAKTSLDDAVARLRAPGVVAFLPSALVARARLSIHLGHRDAAATDLHEAIAIARAHGMRLALADALIERHRLTAAAADLDEAAAIVAQSGYRRREPDIARLRG